MKINEIKQIAKEKIEAIKTKTEKVTQIKFENTLIAILFVGFLFSTSGMIYFVNEDRKKIKLPNYEVEIMENEKEQIKDFKVIGADLEQKMNKSMEKYEEYNKQKELEEKISLLEKELEEQKNLAKEYENKYETVKENAKNEIELITAQVNKLENDIIKQEETISKVDSPHKDISPNTVDEINHSIEAKIDEVKEGTVSEPDKVMENDSIEVGNQDQKNDVTILN